jgi:hypothetical protein
MPGGRVARSERDETSAVAFDKTEGLPRRYSAMPHFHGPEFLTYSLPTQPNPKRLVLRWIASQSAR